MSIGQRLLGMFQTQPDQFQTLLGQYYDPRTARQQWLGGTLQGLGAGLASGEPGAWAQGAIAGGGQGVEDYRKRALLGYQMQQQADNQAYDRSRDAKADEWREKQFLEDQKRYGMDYALRKRQADLSAENNRILRDRQTRQWGQEDALLQGQTNAVNSWTDNFKSQGGDLFSPEMQGVLRSNGIAGVDPQDTVKFRQAQPFIGAGAVGPAFDVISAQPKLPEPYTLAPGAIRYDGKTNTPIAVGAPKTPDTILNMGEPSDNVLRKELGKKEAEVWTNYTNTADLAGGRSQDLQVLDELLKLAPQGPLTGRLAEAFPGFSTAGDAAQSIIQRIAPSMRQPGSGSTSDIEFAGFLKSLPGLSKDPAGNAIISQVMQSKNALDIERGQIVSSYLNNQIDAVEARKQLAAINTRSILSPELKRLIDTAGGAADDVDALVDQYKSK